MTNNRSRAILAFTVLLLTGCKDTMNGKYPTLYGDCQRFSGTFSSYSRDVAVTKSVPEEYAPNSGVYITLANTDVQGEKCLLEITADGGKTKKAGWVHVGERVTFAQAEVGSSGVEVVSVEQDKATVRIHSGDHRPNKE